MTITEKQTNIFTVPQGYYLAHCISGDFKLGAGIARMFDEVYNMEAKLHFLFDRHGDKYEALLVDNVFNLVTKQKYFFKPTYLSIRQALEDMRTQIVELHIEKLAMPKIGCGLDKLQWDKVKNIIEDVFKDIPIEILICYL